jgi:hypothetical protein
LSSAFGCIIDGNITVFAWLIQDLCNRPPVFYNDNYNLTKPSFYKLAESYSLYDWNKPLFNNRSTIVIFLLLQHTFAKALKQKATSWLWKVGYKLIDNSKKDKPFV